VGANVYHSEKSPELAHQEDLRDISQIHSRVLDLDFDSGLLVLPARCVPTDAPDQKLPLYHPLYQF
jgi:hypothetical protein